MYNKIPEFLYYKTSHDGTIDADSIGRPTLDATTCNVLRINKEDAIEIIMEDILSFSKTNERYGNSVRHKAIKKLARRMGIE